MAATLQQHRATNNANTANCASNTATKANPQLKRLVYSKYRELLGSYNDQANAYIDTLPSYMVQKDTGFNLDLNKSDFILNTAAQNGNAANNQQNEMYGAGQRMPAQQAYEAPACVQNAMMTKDKKPFTYTPGGIDLSQIKSERMAKRLARNAQSEGATGIQQQNRPTQPQSPSGSSPSAAASMGAAAMGMPFQVLPPPPPPAPGKNFNGGSAPAPPLPPPSSSNFSNTGTLAPPTNGAGGRGSAPNSPSMSRKSPTPQRFEPPPMGFRPEIKIPPNPMAALRKVPPPVEKNTFWKDEYVKDRSKSPMVDVSHTASNNNNSVNSASSSPQTANANNNGTAIFNNDSIDGFNKAMHPTTTNNSVHPNQTNNNYTNYQQPQNPQKQTYTPPPTPQQPQQSPIKPTQQSPQYGGPQPPSTPQQSTQISQPSPQQPTRPEFRSVAAPTSPAVNVYTRQSDSPRTVENATPPRATESPFKFSQQQQQKAPPAVSPLAQQFTPSSASSGTSVSPNNQAQTVPWRTQRGQYQQPQQTQPSAVAQSHPQPIYNNVHQRTADFATQQPAHQGPKPTNVGSLYIAPLAPPTEPQAQHIVRQQMHQQQQQQRDSPMRQIVPQQQQQPNQQLRWMSTQPMPKEQPAWARPEENGNVVPSSLNRIKSPPPPPQAQQMHQPLNQGNGFIPQTVTQNFGAQPINTTGLRLQINTPVNQTNNQNGPKERIIPIQLEQTPTHTPAAQPSFNQQHQYGTGTNSPASGYVMRTPNQFVDQGYNNFGQQQQQQQQQQQLQPLNAPRMVQQTQNHVATGNKTHIIPITIENNEGTRGPISKAPIVIQNDQRTPPIQSKSFRILQKITDTIDDGSNDDNANHQQQQHLQQPVEPQLQRPTFARQMSAQQARHSPTVEQMRRMQIAHEQGNYSAPTTPSAIKYNAQRSFYDNCQQYIPPSEQQAPEPKKYTGSAIPSRSFKILQAMTQPENADKQENCKNYNEMNEIESKPESNRNFSHANSSATEPESSSSSASINSESSFSSTTSSTPPQSQPILYPPYPYPYGFPWYLIPPPHLSPSQNIENCTPSNWPYPYGMHTSLTHSPPAPILAAGEHSTKYPPFPYYFPYYPTPLPPHMPPLSFSQNNGITNNQATELDMQNAYPPYMTPPHSYLSYPYPVAPSYSQGSGSSRASSVLPDIIITPSADDVPSKVTIKHHNKVEKERLKELEATEIQTVISSKSKPSATGSVVDMLTQQLENMTQCKKNNLNSEYQTRKSYKKNIDQKSPEDNTSPVQTTMTRTESEEDSDQTISDSETTPKQIDKNTPILLKSIKSVNNVQIYKGQKLDIVETEYSSDSESEIDDDDETTADGESDIFDEEDQDQEDESNHNHFELEETSDSEELIVDDSLSIIYEEESEMERSISMTKTTTQDERSNQNLVLSSNRENSNDMKFKIRENDEADEEERDDSTSVTVRLPLKFSFSTSKDAENLATVEVGKSQIEEKITNNYLSNRRDSFNVATVKSDADSDDECDVSVTISLTQSSLSSSFNAKVENKNRPDIYPIEDIPLPEENSEKIESSQEDISVSFSLNMRNKFSNETKDGHNITNNVFMFRDNEVETDKEVKVAEHLKETPDEMDFFATLMATKMQTQKIKEQSASYWGKSQEDEALTKEVQENRKQRNEQQVTDNIKSKASKLSRRKKGTNHSIKKDLKAEKPKEPHHAENISPKKLQVETKSKKLTKPNENSNRSRFSFGDPCTTQEKHTPDERDEIITESTKQTNNEQYKSTNEETEDIVDIWADREEDLPPIKPIKRKLKSLTSFGNTVSEIEKLTENKTDRPLLQPETITKVELEENVLKSSIKTVSQPQRASSDYQNEQEKDSSTLQEEVEIDFWAEIERARESKIAETSSTNNYTSYLKSDKNNDITSDNLALLNSFGETELSMFNDDHTFKDLQEYDPLKYPEEPREVDTDEEIDFWAEIEANRQTEEDDVSFHKSASFWASRERHNSVDETPYKPVLPKAFHAKLPDEPPTVDINIWETLKAYKGEEPVIIDPAAEEQKALVQEYEEITRQHLSEEEHNKENITVHEPVIASVWYPSDQASEDETKTTAKTSVEQTQTASHNIQTQTTETKSERDELEAKRNNYRKAMAFFTTSIDDNKEQNNDCYERSKSMSNRTSYIEEEEEQWDWGAVNEALQKENIARNSEKTNDIAVQEKFVKEQTPQVALSISNNKEKTASTQVFKEPPMKRLSNGLPDLEVNKFNEERKISVKDRISAFETGALENTNTESRKNSVTQQSLSVDSNTRQSSLSRNSSTQRSESEMEEDDSGVTDMNKHLSETDTESESFPELRKMSSYQRASTHSRLFKLLQEDPDVVESNSTADEFQFKPSRKKIVHNVSITRKQNPTALTEAETMSQRRERLSLPLCKNISIDNDNPSTPNSPASPIMGPTASKSSVVSDKLVSELVQSLLLKSDSTHFRNLPMEKLQAAAKKVLEEELDSLNNTSVDSTPAPTPSEMKKDKSYADYYNTWSDALGAEDIVPSKSFRALQDSRRTSWTARCPRVLSSKTINRDLARVTESPEISMQNRHSRENSVGKWKNS